MPSSSPIAGASERPEQLDAFSDDPLYAEVEARTADRLEEKIEERRVAMIKRLPRTGGGLRRWRRREGRWTQQQAAEALGVSRRQLQSLEAARDRALPVRIRRLVAGYWLEQGRLSAG